MNLNNEIEQLEQISFWLQKQIVKANKAVYTPWNAIAMMIKTVPRGSNESFLLQKWSMIEWLLDKKHLKNWKLSFCHCKKNEKY